MRFIAIRLKVHALELADVAAACFHDDGDDFTPDAIWKAG
jgi:hypothetical protein